MDDWRGRSEGTEGREIKTRAGGEDNDVNFNGRGEGEREKAGLQREMEEKRRGGVGRM